MGSYLNPGYNEFAVSTKGTRYVDKTMLIRKTNEWMDSSKKLICMSRPRRFGKTLTCSMLSAYYSKGCDSEQYFRNLKIGAEEGFNEHLNNHDVIYIDVGGEYSTLTKEERKNFIRSISSNVIEEMMSAFPDTSLDKSDSLGNAIRKVYRHNGNRFIIIMDEYDALVRENVDKSLLEEYLLFLNGIFKNRAVLESVSLAFLTGILPIIKDRMQSKLNNFKPQYTFLEAGPLAPFMGFTSEEVGELCKEYGIDFDECRRWYDGYTQNGIELYNPESIIMACESGKCSNYWSRSSTFRVISDQLRENFEGMREDVTTMIGGGSVKVDADSYLNTIEDFIGKDETFTYLIHIGYLSYNSSDHTCKIPNREIRSEWIRAIRDNKNYSITNDIIKASENLLYETIKGNSDAVARALDISHIHVTSNRSYNNEDGLQCAIYLAYIYALNEYTVVREMTAGKGIADMVYIPVNSAGSIKSTGYKFTGQNSTGCKFPAMIIELKRNHSAKGAIKQIENKMYFAALEHYRGELLFVGINYNEHDKRHSCQIHRFFKD